MPHAVTPRDAQDELDDDLIRRTINDENPFGGFGENILERELDLGEKADDAVDFGDLSDDDLADDEDAAQSSLPEPNSFTSTFTQETSQELEVLQTAENENVNELDDLFGDATSQNGDDAAEASVSFVPDDLKKSPSPELHSPPGILESQDPDQAPQPRSPSHDSEDADFARERQLQEELFAMSRAGQGNADSIPHPPENEEELLASLWPKFEQDTIPKFMDLLPSKKVHFAGKVPPKQPKALQTSKLSLDIAQDDEKAFTVSTGVNKRTYDEMEKVGLVAVRGDTEREAGLSDGDLDFDSDYENEAVAGISWQDMQILCGDWELQTDSDSARSAGGGPKRMRSTNDEWLSSKRQKTHHPTAENRTSPIPDDHDVDDQGSQPAKVGSLRAVEHSLSPLKKRKLQHSQYEALDDALRALAAFHDPESATAKIASKVTLDLNDPLLLIDEQPINTAKRPGIATRDKALSGRDSLSRSLGRRYNVSNDEAYDLLKENHQHKVRGTLGNITVEHSLPAVRLQWPFYKTKLDKQEARSFHRPPLNAYRDGLISFSKLEKKKRKLMKGKSAQILFSRSQDLSLSDNSTALLLEYSEEHPTMLSNLGMGSRITNYYRRKTADDDTRPKQDLGDPAVLLPQDKSPFSIFGHIDPGEVTPSLHNQMYRAPIFTQDVRDTDFLVVRSSTGEHGSNWHLRNIDNIRAVGQEFPSVDIPGPHSRKVTTASKNRLKMISYRLIKKAKSKRISVGEVTKHFVDTTDMQNRQKMKEFMQFDKDYKEWRMRPGEAVPEADAIRTMVKPEDVCLLESMQVGQQHLHDAGFSRDDDNSEEDEAKEDQNIEQKLAPWSTSRNFLHATQGKAMLQLHGEGDPSGRGCAFSFIKTSMKGGFKAVGESVAEKIESKRTKEYGGHSYNVARQQQSYEESIRRIWEAQKQSLTSKLEETDSDMDDEDALENSDNAADVNTPRSESRVHGNNVRRLDDETASQSTRFSNRSQAGKILRITRHYRDPETGASSTRTEEVRNPRVIRQYLRRRHAKEAEGVQLSELKPTGDDDADKRDRQRLEKELARLQRNQERRLAREKQKGLANGDDGGDGDGSVNSPATGGPKVTGTQRKCANCGQVGHIKTNKKLCPLLNGTMKPEEGFGDSAFSASAPAF